MIVKIYRNKYDSNTNFINDKYYILDLIFLFILNSSYKPKPKL